MPLDLRFILLFGFLTQVNRPLKLRFILPLRSINLSNSD